MSALTASPASGADQPVTGKKSRAGRNLPAAIGVGVGLIVAVSLSLAFIPEPFVLVAVVAVCAGMWELAQAFARKAIQIPVWPLMVGSAGIIISSYYSGPEALMVSFVLTVAAVVFWRILDGSGTIAAVRDSAAGVFALAYLPFMAGFVVLMLASPQGRARVLLFILLAVANDVGGYVAGVLFGRHPLAPSVSPKKTWEGLTGSFLLATAVAVAGVTYLLDLPWWVGGALGIIVPVTATVGDLAESMIKRDLELKDMGSLLPGHGGILDRLDSMVLTAPFVYVLFALSM